jgi:hypothetical protein
MKLLEEDLRVRSAVNYEKRAALLCTYSPDFNPVEEAFSKIKGALGQAQALTREALIEALGVVIFGSQSQRWSGLLRACSYHLCPSIFYESRCNVRGARGAGGAGGVGSFDDRGQILHDNRRVELGGCACGVALRVGDQRYHLRQAHRQARGPQRESIRTLLVLIVEQSAATPFWA